MPNKALLIILFLPFFAQSAMADKIITIFDQQDAQVLSGKSNEIPLDAKGLEEANIIANRLLETLKPKMPAAGLAAPQIGVSKSVFIFSWDRTWENMEVAINPKILSASPEILKRWEVCFSAMHEDGRTKAALVARPKWVIAEYHDSNGRKVTKKMEGFAAKVFQHEMDHLEGVENVHKKGSAIKEFKSKAELIEFMTEVKKSDSTAYIKPKDM